MISAAYEGQRVAQIYNEGRVLDLVVVLERRRVTTSDAS